MKISLPKNETTVSFKSASFIVIMLLHESLTHIQSQRKPVAFWREFHFNDQTFRKKVISSLYHIFYCLDVSG